MDTTFGTFEKEKWRNLYTVIVTVYNNKGYIHGYYKRTVDVFLTKRFSFEEKKNK